MRGVPASCQLLGAVGFCACRLRVWGVRLRLSWLIAERSGLRMLPDEPREVVQWACFYVSLHWPRTAVGL